MLYSVTSNVLNQYAAPAAFSRSDRVLDTTTSAARMMFGMLGVSAEFERAIISERVKAGMARVMSKPPAKGKKVVGRPKVQLRTEMDVKGLRLKGWGIVRIATHLGIGNSTVQRIVKEQEPASAA